MSASRMTSSGYPHVWVRWATQQVRTAVSYELSATSRLKMPHLRGLPLTIDAAGVDDENYLRNLIAVAADRIPAHSGDRVDIVTAAVLADNAVSFAEPDLQTMVAWWLAAHHSTPTESAEQDGGGGDADDHECIDPEALAADLVGSGLIAPAWRIAQLSELAARSLRAESTTTVRRQRRPTVSPLQMVFPI
jgi:hypothetical protein